MIYDISECEKPHLWFKAVHVFREDIESEQIFQELTNRPVSLVQFMG